MKYKYQFIFMNNDALTIESDADIDFSEINDTKPLKILEKSHKKSMWVNLDNVSFMSKEAEK